MVHFIVSSIAYLSNSQLPARSYLWLVEHKNRSCLWSLQSHAGNCAEPLPGPKRDRSSCGFHMPAKGQVEYLEQGAKGKGRSWQVHCQALGKG